MSTHAVIEVSGLTKEYRGGRRALRGIDFDIRGGEIFVLLGPNGSGKSTTTEILEGYRDRTAGEVRVLGTDPQHGGLDWKARIGIVLQSSGEVGVSSVREQLQHFARFYPDPRDVDEVIGAVGLEKESTTRIKKLSGGQRRRLDVALGVIGRPEMLFLDEPTTGFDPQSRRQFWDLVRLLQREGTTVLLTTHYLDEAAQLADRAGVIVDGRLVDIGTLDAIGSAEARTPIVRWRVDGVRREERTDSPGRLVAQLCADGEPEALEVVRPSLEDVYLDLVNSHREDPGADLGASKVAGPIEASVA